MRRAGQPIKVAVASSGLAHIKRGVETWAEDLGVALRRSGLDATTFQGSAGANDSGVVVGCWKRFDPKSQRLVNLLKGRGGWRIGLGNGYAVEQTTFAMRLFQRIRADFDILHVQDPWLGLLFDRLQRAGLSRPRVIMAHGTEEDAAELKKYSYLQHLAPNYLADWAAQKPGRQMAFAVPNFVDLERFRPVRGEAEKRAARAAFDLPGDAFVVLSVGALKKVHKRMDYVLREFAQWRQRSSATKAVLVIAGAREAETDEILALARELPPGAVKIIENAPRSEVAQLLRAADVFYPRFRARDDANCGAGSPGEWAAGSLQRYADVCAGWSGTRVPLRGSKKRGRWLRSLLCLRTPTCVERWRQRRGRALSGCFRSGLWWTRS